MRVFQTRGKRPAPRSGASNSPNRVAPSPPSPAKGSKGKGRAPRLKESDDGETASEEDFKEDLEPEVKPKPRGRLRKDVLKEAAKRMKRS
ncbi:hypothetical protein PtA15_11A654 [Puccinia triticina]|uniref:Uncharacterized protein n=1 Tax=Puccinia triticina TaxID=208348 RepID=A0ABY7CZV2_9BASI|nr:uncharacterized protein PtA15_11A654 [Puccinia triticina]WAQ89962.1 hypothetical protein PtA15_11A654 [Puccinia triticina]